MNVINWRNTNKKGGYRPSGRPLDDGYVEAEYTDTRILCSWGQHYDAVLFLCTLYFGVDALVHGDYTKEQVREFIEGGIEVESECSNTYSLASDIMYLYDSIDWEEIYEKGCNYSSMEEK